MCKHKLPKWLRLFAHIAPLVSIVSAVFMAGAAIYTALIVKHTADIATGEFALARRPAVFLTDLEPQLKMHSDGSGASLTLIGVLREVRRIPTTVHEIRVGHYYPYWEVGNEARWRTLGWRDVPLYGDHLIRPLVLEIIDVEESLFNNAENRNSEVNTPFLLSFRVEYTLSIQSGPREKWSVTVSVKCAEDGTCTAREPPMPSIESVRNI